MKLEINDLQNESDVEQKLIYTLLAGSPPEGLGFSPSAIQTKKTLRIETIEKGAKKRSYVPDYLLVVGGLPFAVIEAKNPDEDLTEAAREARLYASEVNSRYKSDINPCKFCVVSNGKFTELRRADSDELIVQVPFDELVSSTDSFIKLADLLRADNAKKQLSHEIRALETIRRYRPLSKAGGSSSQEDAISENSFGVLITREFRYLINPTEEEDRANIVNNAYVESRRKQRYVEDIDKLIRAATPPELRQIDAVENTGDPHEVVNRFSTLKKLVNQVLLLIGNVGAGKSTFVDFLRLKALPADVRDKTVWLKVDLNDAPQTADKIYDWCQEKLIAQFEALPNNLDIQSLDGLQRLFSNEVEKFKKGPGKLLEGNEALYNEKLYDVLLSCLSQPMKRLNCFERYFCTNRGKLLVIVLDNCDKRSRDLQLLMFEVARWLQSELRTLVVLPIRDTTYELHKHDAPLDTALKDLIFRIEPPIFQHVLKKRIDLILKDLEGRNHDIEYSVAGKRVVFKRAELAKYLKGMLSSLFENERFARRIITGLAGWDMRKAMEIFLDLCRSGFVDEGWILDHQVTGQPFRLSEDVVLKILMRTHRIFYNGDYSRIKNIYQIDRDAKKPCQFVRYWILLWFYFKADREGPSGVRGFHRCEDVVNDLVSYGVDQVDAEREIAYLNRAGCLISESQSDSDVKAGELVGLTPAGHVHVSISKNYSYLAGCAEDSYLIDEDLADQVLEMMVQNRKYGKVTWTSTNKIAGNFANYLHNERQNWIQQQMGKEDPPDTGVAFDQVAGTCSEALDRIWDRRRGEEGQDRQSRTSAPIQNVRDVRSKRST